MAYDAKNDMDIRYLKGVGEQKAKALSKLGIATVRDLLSYFPRGYEDRTVVVPIAEAVPEQSVCIRAAVSSVPTLRRIRGGMELVKLRASDDTGSVDITFFNQSYVRNSLKYGEEYAFYGKLTMQGGKKSMANPDFEPSASFGKKTGLILPKYRLCSGVSNTLLVNLTRAALSSEIEPRSVLPEDIRLENGLAQTRYAYENIHFPSDPGALDLARKRLIFEELYVLSCALERMGSGRKQISGTALPPPDMESFYSSLGFAPTNAQRRAINDCVSDMASGRAMSRLIQGDVGSGKTLVAAACAWAVCTSGYQTVFMVPTEILANQHYETLSALLSPFGIRVGKLIGALSAKEKRSIKQQLSDGEIGLIVGTHALLTDDVELHSPALIITDEQHRFGVDQRGRLAKKGHGAHMLVMSATPIPRTLALIIYGDLDVSIIDELPPGRQRVGTFAVDSGYRARLEGFMEKQVSEGRQVFVVCPMVEEADEVPGLVSAQEMAERLSLRFPRLRVGCIHGRLKPKEKESIMAEVVAGKIDILVSTTVIEVGVDVPNASLMVVENAERFGLSQLHQLRGRVGRGQHRSWCILVSDAKNEESRARLEVMCKTNDGFKISEEDLRLRGPGDFFGSRQHGLPEMHIASLGGDTQLLSQAQNAAKQTLERDPELALPEHIKLREHISHLFEASADSFN